MPLEPRSTAPSGKPEQQLWRKHFPIDTATEMTHSRRAFCTGVVLSGGAMVASQAALNSSEPVAVETGWVEHPPQVLEININNMADGEAFLFHYPDHRSPCLLVRLSSSEAVAFSQKCTHLACPVIPEVEQNRFHCPCHHGAFDIRTGSPTAGPPRTPLPKIRFEQTDGRVTVSAVQAR